MNHRPINPTEMSYAQAHDVTNAPRLLLIRRQVPVGNDGRVPTYFKCQCLLAWANVEAQLKAAGMTLDNLVKVTTFLSDRRYRQENYETRVEVLGERYPALTVIITG